jgi:hypothetical protein
MTFHTTPRAAEAIIAQMTAKADVSGWFYATIQGVQRDVCAFFKTRETQNGSNISDGFSACWITECDLIGAWAECAETGDVVFAGNRDEVAALVGEAEVRCWEDMQMDKENEQ